MIKKILILLTLVLFITGCSSNKEKTNDPNYIETIAQEPAFQRKRVQFLNTPYSSKPTSKYSITKLQTADYDTDITRNRFLDEKPD